MAIRVMLVDDQVLLRTGFRMVLAAQPDMEVVAEAYDGAEAIENLRSTAVDVVLMDVRMPRLDGVEATRRICARPDAPKVLILTTFDLDEYAFSGLKAGASGFMLKDVPCGRTARRDPFGAQRRRGRRPVHHPAAARPLLVHAAEQHRRTQAQGHRQAHRTRTRSDAAGRAGHVERRDRGAAGALRGDGEDARRPHPHQAEPARPGAGRRARVRDGAGAGRMEAGRADEGGRAGHLTAARPPGSRCRAGPPPSGPAGAVRTGRAAAW